MNTIARNNKKLTQYSFLFLLLLAMGIRVILACFSQGFLTDVTCFYSWALRAYEGGLGSFYSAETFSDYPPGYILVLYVVGFILKLFHADYLTARSLLIVKMPAILCDLAAGSIVYHMAKKKFSDRISLILSAAYLLNPAVLYNSVIWGQVDAVFTLTVVIVCILMQQKKTITAYFVFVAGILLKPQTLIFAPLVLLGIYENVFAQDFTWKKFYTNLFGGLASLVCMVLVALPFGLETIVKQYMDTMGSYPYVSVNAYNFWCLFGQNWRPQEDRLFAFLSFKSVGTIVILLICLFSAIIFLKRKEKEDRYFITGAFIIATMFCFSVRMHERYLFPVMILLLLSYIADGSVVVLADYVAISLFHLLNVWHVLTYYLAGAYDSRSFAVKFICLGTFFCVLVIYLFVVLEGRKKMIAVEEGEQNSEEGTEKQTKVLSKEKKSIRDRFFGPVAPLEKQKEMPLTRTDVAIMLGISVFYAAFAFVNLGSFDVPKKPYISTADENIVLNLPEGEEVTKITWYLADEFEPVYSLWQWNTETNGWDSVQDLTGKNVYAWNEYDLEQPVHGSICLLSSGREIAVNELILQNANGDIIRPTNADIYEGFFDEQDTYPDEIGFMNSSYFDEIYYPRTAHELRVGLPAYEWTHPQLGKIFIMFGMMIFGENPFGYRFAGTLFGVLMIPLLYLLGRNMTRNRCVGAFTAFIFAFDFMHFTQTRICTIDVYITFFVILMYYYMEKYTRMNFLEDNLKETFVPLGASGIAFGLGVSSKWTGIYAGAGLAVIFFATLFRRYRESRYLYEVKSKSKKRSPYLKSKYWKEFYYNAKQTILFCIVFFVIVPIMIYLISYLPYRTGVIDQGWLDGVLMTQKNMLNYHSGLQATHPYSSNWYEWPTMIRPMLYYSRDLGNGLCRGISAFGNPLVWWAGIPAFFYMLYLAICKQDKNAGFLCVGYLAEYLPWFFVSRVVFIYHYFPSVPFLAVMIGYSIHTLVRDNKRGIRTTAGDKSIVSFVKMYRREIVFGVYALAVFGLFIAFYPVLSGAPVRREYVVNCLRWLKDWVLVI